MVTTATIRNHGRTTEPTAVRIATLWNTAYPTMRTIAGTRITAYRNQIRDRAWDIDPTQPHADLLAAHTPTEKQLRRSLKDIENLRRTLHQLNNGTHRPCTQSPGTFSVLAAYSAVRCLLATTSLNTHGLGAVYALASALADAAEERHRELMARTA